jgi:hypothetical protein
LNRKRRSRVVTTIQKLQFKNGRVDETSPTFNKHFKKATPTKSKEICSAFKASSHDQESAAQARLNMKNIRPLDRSSPNALNYIRGLDPISTHGFGPKKRKISQIISNTVTSPLKMKSRKKSMSGIEQLIEPITSGLKMDK